MKIDQELLIPIVTFIIFFILNRRFQCKYANNFEKILALILVVYYTFIDVNYGFFFGLAYMIYLINLSKNHPFEGLENNNSPTGNIPNEDINIIVSRYNEDLKWTLEYPYNKYKYIVYNKGNNAIFEKTNVKEIINIPNVGRESHTYLYHIIKNYDNLTKINVFLPGSCNSYAYNKKRRTTILFNEIEKVNNSIIIGAKHNNVKKELYNFGMTSYKSTTDDNFKENPERKLQLSKIRPYGKWYDNKFPDIDIQYIPYSGIIAISKNHILQHPKKYYENLIEELRYSSNPEVGHFFERSWVAIFYPMIGAKFVDVTSLF
jgi:hypothetical protein